MAMDLESEVDDTDDTGDVEYHQVNPEGNAYIVMPCFNGEELFKQLPHLNIITGRVEIRPNSIVFDYKRIHACFCQLVQGLECLHNGRYNHRDISCENVLMHVCGGGVETSNIIDYGMALHIPPGTEFITGRRVCGKVLYPPPEHVITDSDAPTRGFPSDIWAIGVVLYMLITARSPFEHDEHTPSNVRFNNYLEWIRSVKYNHIGGMRCMAVPVPLDPHSPPVAVAPQDAPFLLKNHPCYNLLKGMLIWSEVERISIDDIKNDNWYRYGTASDYRGANTSNT